MISFDEIKFKGTFRPYQQKVLDNADKFLENGKIHIVAAPGSGKTILGLELIRRLSKPALILSPTITIRDQWIERFSEKFIENKEQAREYCSNSIKKPKLITTITYQALYSAFNKIKLENGAPDEDEDSLERETSEDFSKFDLIKTIRENDISTICLDEAHHLRAEWQKALYSFIKQFEKEVKIIALTATPPYDSEPSQWNKYIDICGEIDDEIFAPQLVRTGTLCPHQDFICFSYPSGDEIAKIKDYRENVSRLIDRIFREGKILNIIENSDFCVSTTDYAERLLDDPAFLKSLLSFLRKCGATGNKKLFRLIGKGVPNFDLQQAEILLQGIIAGSELFREEDIKYVKELLHSCGVVEKGRVNLQTNSRLQKLLMSSVSKLESIRKIADFEAQALGDKLRLLILTDYIKHKVSIIGTDKKILEFGVVPIFELLRRDNPRSKLSAVSGKITIVPNSAVDRIREIAGGMGVSFTVKPLKDTLHSEICFSTSDSHLKIAVITRAFNEGTINAIVGTKSLLGEGWDSPVINTLILASFVGSFMLSNQMRGRAIRTDRNNPEKVGNIWHLCTIIPPRLEYDSWKDYIKDKLANPFKKQGDYPDSYDFEVLARRFTSFVGLNYSKDIVENGIERVDIIKPPYDEDNVGIINQKMLEAAKNRELTAKRWQYSLDKATDEIVIEKEQRQPALHSKFGFFNAIYFALLTSAVSTILATSSQSLLRLFTQDLTFLILGFPIITLLGYCYFILIKKMLLFFSPFNVFKAISKAALASMQEIGLISGSARLETGQDSNTFFITLGISDCSNYEKNIFYNALSTLFSPIENPRYLIIKKGLFRDYSSSFAVPEVLAGNSKNAGIFAKHMSRMLGNFALVYTRSEEGRKILLKCRKRAFISRNYRQMYGKKRLKSKWDNAKT